MNHKLPEIKAEKYVLPNGLQVILHEDRAIPLVAVNIWYHVGSKNEKRGKTGFAHLFEHMMFEGSEHSPDGYFEPLEKVGANLNGSTSEDRTNYWELLPSQYLELALWLESDRMGYLLPAIDQEKLDNQIDVVRNERRQHVENQPYGRVYESMLENIFPYEHPYSWPVIGSMEDIASATLEDVKSFFRQFYTPRNASLCIAGDFDLDQAKTWVEKYFAEIPGGPPLERMKSWTPRVDNEKRIAMEDQVALPRVYLAWPTPGLFGSGDSDLDILANILSSGKDSRLYKTLVYDKQIAQDVTAYQSSNEICGIFEIVATARPGHSAPELEEVIRKELKRLNTEPPTAEEVDIAVNGWEARFIRQLQKIGGFGGKADLLNQYNIFSGTPDFIQKDYDRYDSVTSDSIQEKVSEYINPDRTVSVTVTPSETEDVAAKTGANRNAFPNVGDSSKLKLPQYEEMVLGSGLRVLVIENNKLPLVHLALVIDAGGAADQLSTPGVANMTSKMMTEGTENRNTIQISSELKSIGAILNSSASFDFSSLSMNILKRHLEKGMEIFSDVLLHPTFPAEELERNRKTILAQILQENKEPFISSLKAFFRNLYGKGHPYGQSYTGNGTESSVMKITAADLQGYHRQQYGPNNATMIVAGDIKAGEAVQLLERNLSGWTAVDQSGGKLPQLKDLESRKIYAIDKPGAVQSVIVMGHYGLPRKNPAYHNVEVMNMILGGKFTSRINLNLREDKGYTYGARSLFIYRKGIGPYLTYAPVHAEYTRESIRELLLEFDGIRGDKKVTEEELRDTKNNLILGYPSEFDTIGKIANKFSEQIIYRLPKDTFESYISNIESVTTEDVIEAAKSHIQPGKMQIVVVGDSKVIGPAIGELELGDITYLNSDGDPA